jgi:hypothetical protein
MVFLTAININNTLIKTTALREISVVFKAADKDGTG